MKKLVIASVLSLVASTANAGLRIQLLEFDCASLIDDTKITFNVQKEVINGEPMKFVEKTEIGEVMYAFGEGNVLTVDYSVGKNTPNAVTVIDGMVNGFSCK